MTINVDEVSKGYREGTLVDERMRRKCEAWRQAVHGTPHDGGDDDDDDDGKAHREGERIKRGVIVTRTALAEMWDGVASHR